jgi:hypothetical protein
VRILNFQLPMLVVLYHDKIYDSASPPGIYYLYLIN